MSIAGNMSTGMRASVLTPSTATIKHRTTMKYGLRIAKPDMDYSFTGDIATGIATDIVTNLGTPQISHDVSRDAGRDFPGEGVVHVGLRDSQSVLHRGAVFDRRGARREHAGAHAGGHVPRDGHSGGGGGHVLQRHAAGANRGGHHQPVRALLHAGRGHRAYRIALAARRQRHQGLLSAGDESGFGGHPVSYTHLTLPTILR